MLGTNNIVAFIPTHDYEKSRSFYERQLGLRFVKNDGFAMVLNANGIMIRVVKLQQFTPAQFTILGWEVPKIEAAVAGLGNMGVRFERFQGLPQDQLGIWTAPTGEKVTWFKDPDGNVLSVSQHG
jgi:catechol 2,3-dioxygenase-like lactoylglutathione lyase family enzyme